MENGALTELRKGPGRPANREVYSTQIREAEGKFSDKLPLIADMMVDLATGLKQESCKACHRVLQCPNCEEESRGFPANQRAMEYVLNRIAGVPTVPGEKQVKLEFVRKVARHIADIFTEVNGLDDPVDRASRFGEGVALMWTMAAEGE